MRSTPVLFAVAVLVASGPLLGCKILEQLKKRGEESTTGDGPGVTATTTSRSADKNAPPMEGCALPDNGRIDADVTLKKGCKIAVKRFLQVVNDATLTIEPGVTLEMDAERYLLVDKGKLIAKGTADAPIVFTSAASTKAPGDWVGIIFDDDVSAGTELDHVRIEYAGTNRSGGKGAITLRSQRSSGRISITNTVIENSEQAALWSDSEKGKFAKFENNRMQKNKWSVSVPAEVLGSIGAGNVFTDPLSTFGTVDENATWPAVDAPIFVERDITIAGAASAPTLTIAPKTIVKIAGGKAIFVGTRSGGTLVARDVTFTSANATPQPGDWSGIHLYPRATNVDLSGSTVEYAGKGSGARGAVTVRAKSSELAGLKAERMVFRHNVGAAVSTNDGACAPFASATSEGVPLCAKN